MDKSLFYFCCYLGEHKLRLRQLAREKLWGLWSEGCRPPNPEFFALLPEFEPFRERGDSFWQKGAAEIARERARGMHFLSPEDLLYPDNLKRMHEPPWVVSVMGDVRILSAPALSVVGAREPLQGSLNWMQEHLGFLLQRAPLALASGGARGVDQMAHRLCLRHSRPTLVFVPSGLLNLYPAALKEWTLPVLEAGGAFVSEFHPRTPMRKWHFQMRNRLIAGISWDTLIVEARHQSGSWLTARLALEMGRNVGVVPGSAFEPKQSGNLILLSEGATPIRDAQDLVIALRGQFQKVRSEPGSLVSSIF